MQFAPAMINMKYNPDTHKRHTIRLPHYNYASEGCYFVTLCCADRMSLFGHIENDTMVLNEYGNIAYNEWLNNANKRKNIELDEFIIMPNHLHGIITITENLNPNDSQTPFYISSNTIGAIIRGYKSAVTRKLAPFLGDKIWQRNYYEHIIRDEKSYEQIAEYIQHNPFTWEKDRFYINIPTIGAD
ncbi:transposase [Testudinibacter sp. TR-2022]|uniref:transposase n=1 Tax=Testudinibacter sp. TR-2022 TaxID=2585029 RepID=UPI0022780860|nr:transposase [Testudinibacter sp. TR-2022]